MRRPALVIGAALLITLGLTACQDDDPASTTGPAPLPYPSTSVTTTTTTSADDADCGSGNGRQVPLEPQTDEEALVVKDVLLCGGGANGTFLRNDSTAVLVVDSPAGLGPLTFPSAAPIAVQVFGDAFTGNAQNPPMLPPGSSAYLRAAPAQLHIRLDAGSQVLWDVIDRGVDKVEEQAQGLATSLLAAGSPTRKALLGCAITGYQDGREILDAWQGDDAGEVVSDSLGLGDDYSTCTRELDEATHAEPAGRQGILSGEKLAASLEAPELSAELDDSMRLLRKVSELHVHP